MKTLSQIKEEFAKENGCSNWDEYLILAFAKLNYNETYDEVCIRYANSILEEASKSIVKIEIDKGKPDCYIGGYSDALSKAQKTILKTKNNENKRIPKQSQQNFS